MSILAAWTKAITDPAKWRNGRSDAPHIDIKKMRAQDVLNRLPTPPGWFLEFCAEPSTRGTVEEWISDAISKQFASQVSDPAESQRWADVVNEMVAVCCATNSIYWARQRERGIAPEVATP